MGSLTEKPNFLGFIFTPWYSIEIFHETEIVLEKKKKFRS